MDRGDVTRARARAGAVVRGALGAAEGEVRGEQGGEGRERRGRMVKKGREDGEGKEVKAECCEESRGDWEGRGAAEWSAVKAESGGPWGEGEVRRAKGVAVCIPCCDGCMAWISGGAR